MNIPLDTIEVRIFSTSTRNSSPYRRRVTCPVPFVSDKEGKPSRFPWPFSKLETDRLTKLAFRQLHTSLLGPSLPENCIFLVGESTQIAEVPEEMFYGLIVGGTFVLLTVQDLNHPLECLSSKPW
jgi:hypothetical protein